MTGKPAGNTFVEIELEPGKNYFWCACGHSKTQPFCDGTHQEVNYSLVNEMTAGKYRPVKVNSDKAEKVKFCLCKQTKTPPYCDDSHENL
jgi:CDGSH-type Zn-finger protein